jgi:hypothetical protein
VAKRPDGFVPLQSVARGATAPAKALAEIRRIYFATTRETIDHDFAHAIALLQSLPDEATRERASVYMEGLNEMRREWAAEPGRRSRPARRPRRSPTRSDGGS